LPEAFATLPLEAREAGYRTAIFSENPMFSSKNGFDHYIDATYDDVHRKLLHVEFSPFGYMDEVTVEEGVSLVAEILSRPHRLKNTINTGYAAYRRFLKPDSPYPHHGEIVFSRLESYLEDQSEPTLTVTNVLDPHNPYHGTPPGVERARPPDELAALRAGDDNRDYLVTTSPPPEPVRSVYGDWETFFGAQEEVYEEYAGEADRLLESWHDDQTATFEDALVVVLGDHGQLFGADGMVGHHTSLHPHGVNVPLAIDPPSGWETTDRVVETPVSIAGLGRALVDVAVGEVGTTDALVRSIRDHSRESGEGVLACADGPTWEVPVLYDDDRYDDDLVENLCVRKVAVVREEYVDVYESQWNENEITSASYTYTQDGREITPDRETPPAPDDVEEWLIESYDVDDEGRTAVTDRLEALGYR